MVPARLQDSGRGAGELNNKFTQWLGRKLATLVRNAEYEQRRSALTKFANQPQNLRIQEPHRLINPQHITIGDNVSLGPGCMLNAIQRYPGRFLTELPEGIEPQCFQPGIVIGNRVSATGYLTVSAARRVTIEDDVIIASSVFIGDHSHGRSRVDVAYKYQPLEQILPITIGRGSWLGEHVVVLPGVTIGEFAIVAANSVVSSDVPARTIVAGAPAKPVKRWSDAANNWVSPDR